MSKKLSKPLHSIDIFVLTEIRHAICSLHPASKVHWLIHSITACYDTAEFLIRVP
jgi:hypothetical protein